jgi:hypothetical protein
MNDTTANNRKKLQWRGEGTTDRGTDKCKGPGVRINFMCVSVFISCGCLNKVPQTGWLKTTEIYSLTVSGDQKSKIKVLAGSAPSGGSGGESG